MRTDDIDTDEIDADELDGAFVPRVRAPGRVDPTRRRDGADARRRGRRRALVGPYRQRRRRPLRRPRFDRRSRGRARGGLRGGARDRPRRRPRARPHARPAGRARRGRRGVAVRRRVPGRAAARIRAPTVSSPRPVGGGRDARRAGPGPPPARRVESGVWLLRPARAGPGARRRRAPARGGHGGADGLGHGRGQPGSRGGRRGSAVRSCSTPATRRWWGSEPRRRISWARTATPRAPSRSVRGRSSSWSGRSPRRAS